MPKFKVLCEEEICEVYKLDQPYQGATHILEEADEQSDAFIMYFGV